MSAKVKEIIKEAPSSLSLTADVWTSRATEAYLGVSGHFITDDWQMKTLNLATMPLEDRHTAANIMTWMEEVIKKFDIHPTKIKAVVHDNGSNMVAAMRMLEEQHSWASVRCAGHTLQLVINSTLKEPSISRAVGAARNLVEHFKKSELANTKLKAKQEQMNTPQHKLIQDISTRWNSTYYMVERLLEQRWPVTATLSDPEVTLKSITENSPLVLAAAIDPRFRKLKFLTAEDGTRVQGTIEVLVIQEAKETGICGSNSEQQEEKVSVSVQGEKSALDSLLQSDTDSLSEEEEETQDNPNDER